MIEPYCGPAPVPTDFMARWNFDPVLIAALIAFGALHAAALLRSGETRLQTKSFRLAGAWILLAAAFVSPLCALTSALFSARLAHHIVLVAVLPPLFVLALPDSLRSIRIPGAGLCGVGLVHAVVLWFWHAPAPYQAALTGDGVFWLMELTLLGSATLLWLTVLSPKAAPAHAIATLLGSMIQMSLLGAVITFARAPLYAPHFGVTEPWGLTALADQQLAGLIMWIPGSLPYLVAALGIAALRLQKIESLREPIR